MMSKISAGYFSGNSSGDSILNHRSSILKKSGELILVFVLTAIVPKVT